mmetsp:Transcript_18240/g.35603  ORF Transcript_18240/g.35603 Transcript_18240/m.35603 type:complete len:358 (+) Transcript_18240:140-1213(+)
MAAMAAEGGAVDRAHQRLNDAEKELREAKAKLDAAEVAQPLNEKRVAKAEVGVAEAKWASADAASRETFKGLLDAASETLRTAQETLHNANEGLRIANTAYNQALQAAAPDDSDTSGAMMATLKELADKVGKMDDQLAYLRTQQDALHKSVERVVPDDPWDAVSGSSTSTESQGETLRKKLETLYVGDGGKIKCIVSGVEDVKSRPQKERVVAAHLWPRSRGVSFEQWKLGNPNTSCGGIDDGTNGLFLLKGIEEAYDHKRVCFLCDPLQIQIRFTVLDPSLRDVSPCPAGTEGRTYETLHGKEIGAPDIFLEKRPSFQILSRHAMFAVQHACDKGWITVGEKSRHEESIQAVSPSK